MINHNTYYWFVYVILTSFLWNSKVCSNSPVMNFIPVHALFMPLFFFKKRVLFSTVLIFALILDFEVESTFNECCLSSATPNLTLLFKFQGWPMSLFIIPYTFFSFRIYLSSCVNNFRMSKNKNIFLQFNEVTSIVSTTLNCVKYVFCYCFYLYMMWLLTSFSFSHFSPLLWAIFDGFAIKSLFHPWSKHKQTQETICIETDQILYLSEYRRNK